MLDAALELLTERDTPSITVTALARRAGVGRNTVYRHFRSLTAVTTAARDHAAHVLERRLDTAWNGVHTPRQRLRALCDVWLASFAAQPSLAAVLVEGGGELAGERVRRKLVARLSEALADAARAGIVSLPVNGLRLQAIVAAFQGAARYAATAEQPVDGGAPVLADIVIRTFR